MYDNYSPEQHIMLGSEALELQNISLVIEDCSNKCFKSINLLLKTKLLSNYPQRSNFVLSFSVEHKM